MERQDVIAKSIGKRYVALVDILGFRSLLASTPLTEVVGRIDTLLSEVQRYQVASTTRGERRLGEVHFSDTILMWSPIVEDVEDEQQLIAGGHLFFAVSNLIYRSLIAGIPLRAGIGFGECCLDVDNQIFVGQAIADAYEVESAQEWIGGALHPSVPHGLAYRSTLVEHPVPVKPGLAISPRIALNWPDCPDSPANHKVLKKTVETMDAESLPISIRAKLANTKAFVEKIQNNIRFKAIRTSGQESQWFNPALDPDPFE